jgi:hypothetical protein
MKLIYMFSDTAIQLQPVFAQWIQNTHSLAPGATAPGATTSTSLTWGGADLVVVGGKVALLVGLIACLVRLFMLLVLKLALPGTLIPSQLNLVLIPGNHRKGKDKRGMKSVHCLMGQAYLVENRRKWLKYLLPM